ncbi:MAG: DUF494 family protein [bacterium]|jgi:uncharacterized protein Smg (DUF494 family)|nr:DUF494 family protein [bacterium]
MLTRLIEMVSFILSRSLDSDEEDWGILRGELTEHLQGRGFNGQEIDIAFEVASRIRSRMDENASIAIPFKTNLVYRYLEEFKLTREARGYLHSLVLMGKITPIQREEIVERALFLDIAEVDLPDMQYLVNLVLGGDSWPGEDSPAVSYVIQ